ncbi:glycogen synthase [Pseudoflavitalea sp. G-6-1-2]|uniref:glycogen synthase n=1 Tax=Pseudoflavitalea sp. G-6-1-2 TaxID=2728841 RepID=UPI00146AFAD4|nr:glycogen synthase [Pseudoflavitalea sp. G-6-1-2]NML21511.1 glycogen synthase [Pseudoflavitalea sp. G-6-1-2]
MEILHVSAECYPVAKAGGLGDVVGALPKYLNQQGQIAKVVMPMYRTRFLYTNQWEVVHKGSSNLGNWNFEFTVIRESTNVLGFDLYLVDINGLLDREKIYGYDDDTERFTAFQIAVLEWVSAWQDKPDVIHVHDHHAALIPFMMKYCYKFQHLAEIPSVLTIHNAQYQGWMGWDKSVYLPRWDTWQWGMLDWNNQINPLACGIKCAWKVTTVSPSYLAELTQNSNGLEALFEYEKGKCVGILNGIDVQVWDPASDHYLNNHYDIESVEKGKSASKKLLCEQFGLDPAKPLISFIGRLVGEKGADLLPQAIGDSFYYIGRKMNFLMLGSGFPEVEAALTDLKEMAQRDYNVYIGYNEALSHLMYAGSDFLLMPSRVEPCGLNQMYAMRYGTVPMVRSTGGLIDTVLDMGETNGYGICYNNASVGDITHAIWRATDLYENQQKLQALRRRMMELDYSWEASVEQYIQVYKAF